MRFRRFASVIGMLSLVLAACGGQEQSQGPVASGTGTGELRTGGTLRVGIAGSPDSLNPGLGLLAEAFEIYELVYDTPISVTASGDYEPELATDWSVAEDGVTWTLTLRDDATFHDGERVTATDLKFSLELYRDNRLFPYLSSYPDVFQTVEAVSDTELRIVTSRPVNNFEYRMLFMYVLPEHIWAAVGDPATFANTEMIGSGPFRLTEFRHDEFTRLAAFDGYYAGRPNIDEVIFHRIDNPDARVNALTTDAIDLLGEFPVTALPALQNAENVEVFIADVAAGGDLSGIVFNVMEQANCPADDLATADVNEAGVCSGHPALRDLQVRRALAAATNKQELIDVAEGGLATPGLGLVPVGLGEFYASHVPDYPYDIAAAAQMLEAAGYLDSNGDGIRECRADQGCETLTFRLTYPSDSDSLSRQAEIISGQWGQVGVAVQIQGNDPNTLSSICCQAFDYDALMWGGSSDPDPQSLLRLLLCSEIPNGINRAGYCNPAYDALYAQQGVEADPARRLGILHELQRIAFEDVPHIITYYPQRYVAYRTDTFSGWPTADPSLGLTDPSSLRVIQVAD